MRLRALDSTTTTIGSSPQAPGETALTILGVPVDRGDLSATMARLNIALGADARAPETALHVVTLNPEYVMRARQDERLRHIIGAARVRVADGAGLIAAARLLAGPQHGIVRVTGNDLIAALAAAGVPLFLLGAAPGVAEEAAAALVRSCPQVCIAGTWAGSAGPEDDESVRCRINATNARVVIVAYGMPKQDHWIARNLPYLDARVAIGVGGAFDYLAERVPRAPMWMRARGLEWLYRLIQQPWRWRRILTVWQFAALVLFAAAWQSVRARGAIHRSTGGT